MSCVSPLFIKSLDKSLLGSGLCDKCTIPLNMCTDLLKHEIIALLLMLSPENPIVLANLRPPHCT